MSLKITFSLTASLAVLLSCAAKKNQQAEADCPPKPCTMEFRTVGVVFTDSKGDTLQVKDFSVTLKATGKKLPSGAEQSTDTANPFYMIASDGDKSALSVEGDTVVVSGTHPSSGQVKKTDFVISGGRCECHINKVSGPEKIVF